MDKFLETGVHPEVERARAAQQDIVAPLPERSLQRQHVFLDLSVSGQVKGGWGLGCRGCWGGGWWRGMVLEELQQR